LLAILLIISPAPLSFEKKQQHPHRLKDRIRSCLGAVGEDSERAKRLIAPGDLASLRTSSD
jgi:hypothetical protein